MSKTLRLLGTVNSQSSPTLVGAADLPQLLDRFLGQHVRVTIMPNSGGTLRLEGDAQLAGVTVLIGRADLAKALAEYHSLPVRMTISVVQNRSAGIGSYQEHMTFAMWMRRCIAYSYPPNRMLELCPPALKQGAGL
jgi:hypothetical protein